MPNYERIGNDAYMTPKWCVYSLLSKWKPRNIYIWEPACGTGNIAEVLRNDYYVYTSDIHDYGYNLDTQTDFLKEKTNCSTIITNPPYTLIQEFIEKALEVTKGEEGQVVMLLRHEWDAPKSHRKYLQWPFAQKILLPKRPLWIDGAS